MAKLRHNRVEAKKKKTLDISVSPILGWKKMSTMVNGARKTRERSYASVKENVAKNIAKQLIMQEVKRNSDMFEN